MYSNPTLPFLGKTTVTGCLTHNHVDNPTMKKLSWMTKRRIAKYLLLGHRKTEVANHILPRFRAEGQKIVGMGDVSRVSDLLKSGKHAKLRQGLDALTLLVKDDSDSCLRGVYPWPPEDYIMARNKKSLPVPLQKASAETQTKLQVSPRKNGGDQVATDQVETDQAVASIVEIRSTVANVDDQGTDSGDEAIVEPVAEDEVSSAQTAIETEQTPVQTVANDAIDVDAFQVGNKFDTMTRSIYDLQQCHYK